MYYDNRLIVAQWERKGAVAKNWGDLLNPLLINKLSLAPVVHIHDVTGWEDRPIVRAIGSSLRSARPNNLIWGLGFITFDSEILDGPHHIFAVRGPLSGRRLKQIAARDPEIYGDPSILLPLIYYPNVEQQYDVGIIQHYREFGKLPPPDTRTDDRVIQIDICSGVQKVVLDILSCKRIISSSLHGIICAHAYGVSANWMKASDMPIGDDFKFHDYYSSIGHYNVSPGSIVDNMFDPGDNPDSPEAPVIDSASLIDCCPFLPRRRKADLIARARSLKSLGKRGLVFDTLR